MKIVTIIFASVCVLLETCGCAAQNVTRGIPNLALVEPGVWRGGQPTAEGWVYLKSLGVTNDIKLNPTSEASDSQARSNGIQVIYLPISWIQQTIGHPNSNSLYRAVHSIKTGTFIHCKHGQDRTGLVVGMYRVEVEHWPKDKAYSEMQTNHFHPFLRGLWETWEDNVQ